MAPDSRPARAALLWPAGFGGGFSEQGERREQGVRRSRREPRIVGGLHPSEAGAGSGNRRLQITQATAACRTAEGNIQCQSDALGLSPTLSTELGHC